MRNLKAFFFTAPLSMTKLLVRSHKVVFFPKLLLELRDFFAKKKEAYPFYEKKSNKNKKTN